VCRGRSRSSLSGSERAERSFGRRTAGRRASLAVVSVVACLSLLSPAGFATARPLGPALPSWGPGSTHLQHIITVMLENRDYDNYFGAYCLHISHFCSVAGNGIPAGTCVPYAPSNPALGCIRPWNFTSRQFSTPDMEHDWYSGAIAWDNGAMDGFYPAEGSRGLPFGHFNGTTLPIYWDMAEQYAIGDNYFAGNLSYSLPNHWYLIAGQVPPVGDISYLGSNADRHLYLNESNTTRTVQDLLNRSTVSWKYYDWRLLNRSAAVRNLNYVNSGSAYDYWNPMAARAESYTSWYVNHFAPRGQILTDIANGSLPQISWVIPDWSWSDHAPANVTNGEAAIAQLVNTVENSSYWNSTALFVIWDDYGGYYDHVAPPRVHSQLLSFRSPILVISPYAKENFISHQFLDTMSLLRFVEWQFRLGCVNRIDCNSPLPFDFFNFNQTARAPILFATDWTQATYPMPLQSDAPVGLGCRSCLAVSPSIWSTESSDTNASHDD
jgi:phospholipase C